MSRWFACLALALVACGGAEPSPDAAADDDAPRTGFIPAELTTSGMQAPDRETMRFVAEAGEVVVEAKVDRRALELKLTPDLVALRIADVPSLEYPVGVFKLDPLSLDSGDERRDALVVDALLRTLGSPVQVFFDVHSVGEMQGRLVGEGSSARGQVLGTLQIDDRQESLALDAVFTRSATDRIQVEVASFDLSLSAFALADKLGRLAKLLGARRIDPTVKVSATFELQAFTGEQLPTFVRTPITVNRTEEVRARLDAEIEDHEAVQYSLERQGLPPRLAGSVTEKFYEAAQEIKRKQNPEHPIFEDEPRR